MLGKNRRLDRVLFNRVRSSRLSVGSSVATLRFVDANQPGRFSVVVPKSLAKNAVSRNRLRRAVYSCLGPISAPINGIIYMRKAVQSRDAIIKDLQELLASANKTQKRQSLKDARV